VWLSAFHSVAQINTRKVEKGFNASVILELFLRPIFSPLSLLTGERIRTIGI